MVTDPKINPKAHDLPATAVLLEYPTIIDISANTRSGIVVPTTDLTHQVYMEVPSALLNAHFKWSRATDSEGAPVAKIDDPAALFAALTAPARIATLKDLDATNFPVGSKLDFTVGNLDAAFRPGPTMNALVMPWVLYKLFGSSDAKSDLISAPSLLTEDSPLMGNQAWIDAYLAELNANPENIQSMFEQLMNDTGRFDGDAAAKSAIYDTKYKGEAATGDWKLHEGDIIQFMSRFTFANSISFANTNNLASTPGDSKIQIVSAGDQFVINFQIRPIDA